MQEGCTWPIFNNAEKENIKLQFVMDTPRQVLLCKKIEKTLILK